MAIVKVETELSTDNLLKAVGQLNKHELEQFVSQIINLRAQRLVHRLSQAEAQFLVKINQGLPAEVQRRYDELIDKRRDESVSSEEHSELLRLTDQIENLEAQRMQHLSELARYRKVSLAELMENMGLQSPAYA
ncbi:MAG: STAS/SEC14 domain-containing protein [Thermodesulfobacteriota bacterium]|nr:STAS/SEC14 domain-containing protein [Thermodesulfobacteriota bacterium]